MQKKGFLFQNLNFKKINKIINIILNFWIECPDKMCKNYVRRDGDNKKMKCNICGTEFCFECSNKWHEGMKCEEVLD